MLFLSCSKKLWFDFIIFYKCLIWIEWEFTVMNWMTWITVIKIKMIFLVIIMFFEEKIISWFIVISFEKSLNIIWFLLKISLKILLRILLLFIWILQSKIITTVLIKILIILSSFFFSCLNSRQLFSLFKICHNLSVWVMTFWMMKYS